MIVKIALPLILAFIMFSLGLGLRKSDFLHVFKYPKAFAAGLFNQLILLPIVAFVLALAFKLPPELAVGFMILSLCPGGVTTNILTKISNGNTPLSISLTGTTSLLSTITVPFLVAFFVSYFMGQDGQTVNVSKLGIQMFLITAVPVIFGMLLTANAPKFVAKASGGIAKASLILFVLIAVAAIAKNFQVLSENLSTLAPSTILLNVILLIIGLLTALLIKLNKTDGTTIAIESGVQNSTLGIAVGLLIASEASALPPTTLPSAVYGITMYLVTVPFVLWRRKVHSK
ncbi:bile acid:sodium symporter family protein [Puniceicoccaceae bacterium K14]|nr:bile acid:sodium symporter family protein [Puniceicoccaceae bacterium K14]